MEAYISTRATLKRDADGNESPPTVRILFIPEAELEVRESEGRLDFIKLNPEEIDYRLMFCRNDGAREINLDYLDGQKILQLAKMHGEVCAIIRGLEVDGKNVEVVATT